MYYHKIMRLPEGWNSELVALQQKKPNIDGNIERAKARAERISRQAGALATARYDAEEKAWAKIRRTHTIEHPEPQASFESDEAAAGVVRHYWQGAEIDEATLMQSIMGFGSNDVYKEAIGFATHLTEPGSPEREYVESANAFLWRDYQR